MKVIKELDEIFTTQGTITIFPGSENFIFTSEFDIHNFLDSQITVPKSENDPFMTTILDYLIQLQPLNIFKTNTKFIR